MKTDNELISEFMGATIYKEEYGGSGAMNRTWNIVNPIHNGNQVLWGHEMKYSTSWDWLMPVLEKAKSDNLNDDNPWEGWPRLNTALMAIDISLTYKYLVEFIKWHNNQSKS